MSGTASVLKEGRPVPIGHLGMWSACGERALLRHEQRFASIQATSDALALLKISRGGFERALGVPLDELIHEQSYASVEGGESEGDDASKDDASGDGKHGDRKIGFAMADDVRLEHDRTSTSGSRLAPARAIGRMFHRSQQ